VAQAQTALFKAPVRTAQQTLNLGYKTNHLALYRAKDSISSEIDTKHTNTV
jgi:hypothetical protein